MEFRFDINEGDAGDHRPCRVVSSSSAVIFSSALPSACRIRESWVKSFLFCLAQCAGSCAETPHVRRRDDVVETILDGFMVEADSQHCFSAFGAGPNISLSADCHRDLDVSPIPERVQIAHHRGHALVENMRVNLRRRNVSMAEQLLHDAQIRAIL
jgi:hypothetical protein